MKGHKNGVGSAPKPLDLDRVGHRALGGFRTQGVLVLGVLSQAFSGAPRFKGSWLSEVRLRVFDAELEASRTTGNSRLQGSEPGDEGRSCVLVEPT